MEIQRGKIPIVKEESFDRKSSSPHQSSSLYIVFSYHDEIGLNLKLIVFIFISTHPSSPFSSSFTIHSPFWHPDMISSTSSRLPAMALSISTLLFLFFVASSAADLSSSWRSEEEVMGMYQWWMAKHGKAYNGLGEKEKRFEIFRDNLKFIDEHNAQNRTYKVGLNRFADLTNEEYRAIYLGTRSDPKRRFAKLKNASPRYAVMPGEVLPESVDWRETGAVNPVKDQRSCGQYFFLNWLECHSLIRLDYF